MTIHSMIRPVALAAVVVLAACAGKEDPTSAESSATRQTAPPPAPRPATPPPPVTSERIDPAPVVDASALLRDQVVIYFEFDSAALSAPAREVVEAHADYLIENPGLRVRLEGHTDERGTREYNLALGEGRAQSVEQIMLLRGVPAAQLSVASFGEEQPADLGHDENAWALNRRVQINYR